MICLQTAAVGVTVGGHEYASRRRWTRRWTTQVKAQTHTDPDGRTQRRALPPIWLVFGLEWPEDGDGSMAEAAYAVAPSLVPRHLVPSEVAVIYRLALEFSAAHSERVVFFSDLTRELAALGLGWEDAGVDDWMTAQDTMRAMPVAALYLTISSRAHAYLCDATWNGITWHYAEGTSEHDPSEKDRVRAAFQQQLENDWPAYIEALHAEGRVTEYDA